MNNQSIDDIRKKFKNEWLLIDVSRMDNATTKPVFGKLLAHDRDRDVIYKKSLSCKGLVFIDHSGSKLPKGYAVAF